jgi:RNA polymerase sigma factor (sigma-70 family)
MEPSPLYAKTDHELLCAYADRKDERAFAELVRRYQDTVHSACRRRLSDPVLAQDAAQTTFLLLSQRAAQLRTHTSLGGWLYQTALFQSANMMRCEQTRDRAHERMQQDPSVELHAGASEVSEEEQIRPHLDDALLELEEDEREAVVLRFFGNRSLRDVGMALNTTEEAARKRVSRALERLAGFLKRRGATSMSTAMLGAMLTQSTEAAPVDLLPKITASVHGTSLLTQATAQAVFWAKIKLVAAILALGVVPIAWQWLSNHRLQSELAALRMAPTVPKSQSSPVDSWEPNVERPGALSLTRPEPANRLLTMLAGVWAVESRRGIDSRLALLRQKLQLTDAQVESASAALRQSQLERAELVQSIAQGDAQFDTIIKFLRAEDGALEEIAAELSPSQRAGLSELRAQEKQLRAENLARWRLADLESQFAFNSNQKERVFAALVEHARTFDLEDANQFKTFDELLAWLEARQSDEAARLRKVLNDSQFTAYLAQPDRGRSTMDVLQPGDLNPTP